MLVLAMAQLAFAFPMQAAADEALQKLGVVGPGAYMSPQFQNEVQWTEDWTLDEEQIQSDPTLLLDRVSLLNEEDGTAVIMFVAAAGELPDAYAKRLVRFRSVTQPDAEVVWSESTEESSLILYSYELEDRNVASLIEIRLVNDDETIQVVELLVYEEHAEKVFNLMQADIRVDRAEPFTYITEFPIVELED
jgi:hypothetical protein